MSDAIRDAIYGIQEAHGAANAVRTPARIHIGDTIQVRGGFGLDRSQPATVTGLTVTPQPRSKYGTEVKSVPISIIRSNRCIIDLQYHGVDYPQWAYGEQVDV